ncbi:cupredoxin domain-containing protein [Hydrogenophaga aquatica]
MNLLRTLLTSGLVAASAAAYAHGDQMHAKKAGPVKMEQKPWGVAGEARKVARTVEVKMTDDMRFTPGVIRVKQGETIRLVHLNNGQVMHEFVLGTRQELDEHAALMKKFPDMEHDEPYMAHVGPGKKGEIIWTFNRVGEFDFACLLPGHYEAGMVGKIQVVAK